MKILNKYSRFAAFGAGLLVIAAVLSPIGAHGQPTIELPSLVQGLFVVGPQERSGTPEPGAGPGGEAGWADLSAGATTHGPEVSVASAFADSTPQSGAAVADSYSLAPVSVPEPSAAGLAMEGLLVFALVGGVRFLGYRKQAKCGRGTLRQTRHAIRMGRGGVLADP